MLAHKRSIEVGKKNGAAPANGDVATAQAQHDAAFVISCTAGGLKRSVMRDLMGLAVNPEIISLAGGLPANDALPVSEFASCVEQVLRRDGSQALQYGPPFLPLKEWLAGYMQRRGVRCQPEEIFITNGAQHGLSILSRLFCDRGDPVVTEAVTFTGIQQVTGGRGLAVRTVPTDLSSGVDVEALACAFATEPRPRLAILIPNFHNPMGVSIAIEKREKIAALAAEYKIPVVEDDPYSPLRFEGEHLPALKAFDRADRILYLGSFSKMLAPAVRLGWIVAPKQLADRITVLREAMDLESSQLMQRAAAEFLINKNLETHLERLNTLNLERRNTLLASLGNHLGDLGVKWTKPEGGLFVWVTLPAQIDAWDLFPVAVEQKVAYIPGTAFAVEGGYRNTMRLNFSNATPENIAEAVKRLATVIRRHGAK